MRTPHLVAGFVIGAVLLALVVLLGGCAQDGSRPLLTRQGIELATLSGLKAGAEIYIGLKPCADGQDVIHDQCAKPEIADKVKLAIPLVSAAIEVLRPLVNSTDQAAIDNALKLADQAKAALNDARAGQ